MIVQLPKDMFQEKDYMNMRYFYRRAYYIAYIAAHVRKELGESMDLSFANLNENPLLPVLVLYPQAPNDKANVNIGKRSSSKPTYSIRLIPCAPDNLFPWPKVTPNSNNNRPVETESKKSSQMSTPFYNSTLNAERTFIQYLRLLTHARNECAAFADACILGRIWLQQRGYGSSISQGGFGHFEWAVLAALLLQIGGRNGQAVLSNSLSSTELFKAVVNFLSTTDLSTAPFAFGSAKIAADTIRESGPVIFDPIRELNILYKMSPWSASLLQVYAKTTTDLLADETADKFEATFIVKADIPLQIFDAVFQIRIPDAARPIDQADRRGAAWNFSQEVHRVLKKAYGQRAQLIHLQQPARSSWALTKTQTTEDMHVLVGVIFDSSNMSRQMDYGPPAEEQKEAARFRQFWGEKAELRRFKDGSILECVEWSSMLPLQICEEITHYILRRHSKIASAGISMIESGFSSIISLSHLDKGAFDAAKQAFQTLERDIRGLEDMPLHIRQLSPISAFARYSSTQLPLLGFHHGTVEPMDVNLYFEVSNRWPENLVAIQEAKIEFLLDIDRRLTSKHEKITTYLGRENRELGVENLAYLDIVYENGAAFRLRIQCDVEDTLLERQVNNKTLEPRIREEAEAALARFRWSHTTLPLHTQMVATFCTRLHPLSQTIRLVKQWFISHKLSSHISEELIELFVLHVFLQPYPWKTPSSVLTGFLRTLFFLSKWDWRDEALIVDSAETLTEEERSAVRDELQASRKRDPNLNQRVMFVATSHDPSGLVYTRNRPSKLAASRMTRLAKAACKIVRDEGINLDPSTLFETALQDYDVLIHLSPKAVKTIVREAATEAGTRKPSQFKNLDAVTGTTPLPMRIHPVGVLVEELQRVYDDTLIFFPGGEDDNIMAAIWNPKLQQKQKFRAGLSYNFCASKGDEDAVEVNRKAILLEIARAGGDVIRKVEVLDEDEDEE